jgi:hypothetical protein
MPEKVVRTLMTSSMTLLGNSKDRAYSVPCQNDISWMCWYLLRQQIITNTKQNKIKSISKLLVTKNNPDLFCGQWRL